MRRPAPRRLLPAVLLASCAGGASGDDADDTVDTLDTEVAWADPDQPGPFQAGVTTWTYVDGRGKDMTVEVWYPARPIAGDLPDPYPELPVTLTAFRDAPPDRRAAPYPLVAFSHGLAAIRYQSPFLTEHLATHGFVVVAPDHPGTILLWVDQARLGTNFLERPDDVRSAVDEAIRRSDGDDVLLGGMVDGDVYAVAGHSLGAMTALVVGGAVADLDAVKAYCADHDTIGCDIVDKVDPADVPGHGTRDERAITTIAMSPGAAYAFGADHAGLASVVDPLMLGGTIDNILDYEDEQVPVWQALPTPKSLATLERAGHYGPFSDLCSFLPGFYDCAGEAGGYLEPEAGHAIVRPLVTAWLGTRLKHDDRYAPWLDPARLADVPGLVWDVE